MRQRVHYSVRMVRVFCLLMTYHLSLFVSFAQEDTLLWRDYAFVQRSDVWNISHNASALTRFSSKNISEAALSFSAQHGGLTNYGDASSAVLIDAGIESLYRVSKRAVFWGGMNYENFSGENMAGSVFVDPSHKPFDIVEDSTTNLGDKHRDTYHLTGGVGVDVYRGISVGARVDYVAANYAKYKDLRHKTKLMDITATVGFYAPLHKKIGVGAVYYYRRNTESVIFSTYGKVDKVYKSLVDYGGFFGKVEQFGSTGYTDKSREMPLFDERHGGAVQLEVLPLKQLAVFADVLMAHRQGYYGRKSPYTISYTHHSSDIKDVTARAVLTAGTAKHYLDFSYNTEAMENFAETYRERRNASEASYYEYLDPVQSADKEWTQGRLTYTFDLDVRHEMPAWTFSSGYGWNSRKQTAYLYPYYRRQRLNYREVFASGSHTMPVAHGLCTVAAQASFLWGEGKPYEDGVFVEPADNQTPPPAMEAWLYQEYRYLTAPQYRIGASVQYAFLLPHTGMKSFVRLGVSHRKANESYKYNNGKDRTEAILAIGCTF